MLPNTIPTIAPIDNTLPLSPIEPVVPAEGVGEGLVAVFQRQMLYLRYTEWVE